MAKSILIKSVWKDGAEKDILISGNKFSRIAESISEKADVEIDGKGKAILPPFYNGHCHAAMTLLRGFADDMVLDVWLNKHIWPAEDKMDGYDIYVGSKLAILEMIKSGTVFFNDMYGFVEDTVRACAEMGIRAQIGVSLMDRMGKEEIDKRFDFLRTYNNMPETVRLSIAPHAIYTVGNELYKRCVSECEKNGQMLHTHLSETQKEIDDCLKEHKMRPVELMEKLGVVNENSVFAHVVHTTDEEADILAKGRSVIVTNPTSNMKLSSGAFHFGQHTSRGGRVVLGTDGTSSNNNLDMMQEMKFAALLAKLTEGPESAPAERIYEMATREGALAFGIDAGEIAEGRLADAILVDMKNERLVPNFNIKSNMVYSADSACVATVICNGEILMRDRKVKGEEEIIEEAVRVCKKFEAR